jgi:hypothetical protein
LTTCAKLRSMNETQIRKELAQIAVAEIGKKHIVSADAAAHDVLGGAAVFQIFVELRHDAPDVSGDVYVSILLKARDFLAALGDERRPTILLKRAHDVSASPAK